jgi:signal transduction histidine kinase
MKILVREGVPKAEAIAHCKLQISNCKLKKQSPLPLTICNLQFAIVNLQLLPHYLSLLSLSRRLVLSLCRSPGKEIEIRTEILPRPKGPAMAPQDDTRSNSPSTAYRLARLLRHEVGDLLQSVYSTVGILLERLPETLKLERQLISDLKNRAELCKFELDAVVELASAQTFALEPIDLMSSIHTALLHIRRRFPGLGVHVDAGGPVRIVSDPRALATVLSVLFPAVCQGAQRQVLLRVQTNTTHAECVLQRDGYSVTKEQLGWLIEPFASTQQALLGVGLALTQRLVKATGGAVFADNRPEGGVRVCIRFPMAQDV